LRGCEEWWKDAICELGVEEGEALSIRGELVAMAVDAVDEAVEAQPAQIVGHLPCSGGDAEQSGDEGSEAPVGEAGDGVEAEAKSAGQGYGAWVPEAQGSGSLALPYVGLLDPLEKSRSDGTALAGRLHFQDTTVGVSGLGDELGEMVEAAKDAEVVGRVDDRLDAEATGEGMGRPRWCVMNVTT
jgi:hypothetical protein